MITLTHARLLRPTVSVLRSSLLESAARRKMLIWMLSAFSFHLIPAVEKKDILGATAGKAHRFAVKTRAQWIEWIRELMLVKALKQKRMAMRSTLTET